MRSVRKERSQHRKNFRQPMLAFTQTPPRYAPLGQRAGYTVKSSPATTFDIRLINSLTGEPIAVRRYVETTEATFDAAPCVRRTIRYAPQNGKTGFTLTPERTCTVSAIAQPVTTTTEDTTDRVSSPDRVFYAACDETTAPALLTTMPLARLLAPGEQDELTLLATDPPKATLTAYYPATGDIEGCNFTTQSTGLVTFRVDPSEFPGAERIEVEAEGCGTVVYTIIPPLPAGRRIAWRSRSGSVEHYTFPIEETMTVIAEKSRIYGIEGHTAATTAAETRFRLRSAFEGHEVLEALTEILLSPDVWQVDRDGYTPIDVTSDRAVIHRHGALGCLEIEIRNKRKTPLSWS